ncbi:MAG TPA: arginine--tRNA ligase [Gemmatimonadales bacterium]|nr:arginine--tRNA ligase [Gemmatimonadales bacterium]
MAHEAIRAELARVAALLGAPDSVAVELETPRDPAHGDVATNLALLLARHLKAPPRALAERIVAALRLPPELVSSVEVAGPGFINFRFATGQLGRLLADILAAGSDYGRSRSATPLRINVEFVSANPTGPLHVAHGRGAALGDCVASLLEWQGHSVSREFYVNDAGAQVERLGESVWARLQQQLGREAAIPEQGYHGGYVAELASQLIAERGAAVGDLPPAQGVALCRDFAVAAMKREQRRDLEDFRVRFEVWFEESRLHSEQRIGRTLAELERRGMLFEEGGALWLRTTAFGDDKDRVLRKSDGSFTYFTPDIAYHEDKARRGFDRAIDVWGADHHGYVPRMRAAMMALGHGEDFFEALIVQLVTVVRHGEEVKMSKRAGTFVTLRDLMDEVGVDAARYFFLMRRADTPFAFDIDLALKRTEENPVFYVQMAHARMSGIFRVGAVDPKLVTAEGVDIAALREPVETELLKQLARFPETLRRAADALEPQRVTAYLEDLARVAHNWYHHCRVLGEAPEVERARLALARATQIVLANGLRVLGLGAPERM